MKRTTSGKQQKKEMQKIYKSEVVLKHHDELSNIIDNAVNTTQHHDIFGDSYTWSYGKYNIFGFTSATKVFYDLFCELNAIVYDYNGTNEPLWMQSWLNYHEKDGLLDWHGHQWPIHGYISIRPHNTKTIFRNPEYEVINEVGNVYIGPGYREHKVISDKNTQFDTNRITIGFDILKNVPPHALMGNIGLIPFPQINRMSS